MRLWSIEEVYKQAAQAAWGVHDPAPLTPADSAQSSHTAALAEDGQEVLQGTPLLWQHWAFCYALLVAYAAEDLWKN